MKKVTNDDLSALFLVMSLWVVWFTLFSKLVVDWSTNPQYSYGWGVPFLAAYLGWKRWQHQPPPAKGSTGWIIILLLVGCLLLFPMRIILEAHPDWRFVSWFFAMTAVLFTWLILAYVGGISWRRYFIFPAFFVLVALPWPTFIENWVIQTLMQVVATITVEVLYWFGVVALQEGNLIRLAGGVVGINEACSGVRSIQAMFMASLFLGELYRFNVKRRLWLVGLGVGLAFGFNVIRAIFLTLLVDKLGTGSLEAWHDPAGFLILFASFTSLCLIALPWIYDSSQNPRQHAGRGVSGHTAALRLPPRVISIGLFGWLCFVEAANETWYRYHESIAGSPRTWTFDFSENSHFKEAPIPDPVKQILRFSKGDHWIKSSETEGLWMVWFVEWEPGRSSVQLARSHSPEICLEAVGLEKKSGPEIRGVKLNDKTVLPFRVYTFRGVYREYLVYFCLWEDQPASGRNPIPEITDGLSRKSRIQAVLNGERHNGQRMLQIVVTKGSEDENLEEKVDRLVREHVQWVKP